MVSEAIICSAITGGLTLIGVLASNNARQAAIDAEISKRQAVTDQKIEDLTREVRKHNNFAQRMPVVENEIVNIKKQLGL